MIKFLVLFSALLPIACFSQGFGSFSHDQPFLAVNAASPASNFATNLLYRWVATDLPTNTFTVWTDRLLGRGWGVPSGFSMANTAGGVQFSSDNELTNGTADPMIGTTATNWSIGFMLNTSNNISGSSRLWRSVPASPNDRIAVINMGSGNVKLASSLDTFADCATMTFGTWHDVLFVQTNSSGGTYHGVTFLDGVFYTENVAGLWPFVYGIGLLNETPPNGSGYSGYIREIWCRTNKLVSFTDLQSMASDLHYTRTNLYGP